jgi:Ca2+-binding RTX toxin-like protein
MAIVHGTDGWDWLDYSAGVTDNADTVYGRGGTDVLYGHGGGDTLIGGEGVDALDGGAGNDTASYVYSDEGVIVDLVTGQGEGGPYDNDYLESIENLTGSPHADWLAGDNGSNVLSGEGGDDFLKGGGGADTLNGSYNNDTLAGGVGADTLNGGFGWDTADYADSNAAVFVSLLTDDAADGHAQGDDLNSIENVTGSAYADQLWGDDGVNELRGQDGGDLLKGFGEEDSLYGGGGADTLQGMDGDDLLQGQNGQDTLNGGDGRDDLYGGNGADTFSWSGASDTGLTTATADAIRDFNRAQGDEIDFSAIDADIFAAGDQAFSFIGTDAFSGASGEIRYYHSGGDTYIEMQIGDEVDVEGVIRLDGIHDPLASWFVL